ncbi:MAG TPA: glycosyltransferase family 39 protein, partial [Candidatus Saccharimonadales bacterium]|nr:glycosyltransferase family 39 protein [Candidatus Saccharimonadales bacterium]
MLKLVVINSRLFKENIYTLLLLIILCVGIFLRFCNILPSKLYPDSYQNIVVARNIVNYHSVLGFLGKNGLSYPYVYFWTRPGFPLLINIAKIFVNDEFFAAQVVSFVAGILIIIVTYFALSKLFSNKNVGIAGAALAALSFNLTVWGGFILTEASGVLFLSLFLFLLFRGLIKKSQFLDINDLLIGAFFGFAILIRYEYLLIALPLVILIFQKSESPGKKLLNILVGFVVVTYIVLLLLFPVKDIARDLFSHVSYYFSEGIIFFVALPLIFCIKRIKAKLMLKIVSFLWIVFIFIYHPLGMRDFFVHDFLLGIVLIIGLFLFYKKEEFLEYLIFILFSSLLLALMYYKTNPVMARYYTNLLPFLFIPAAYGLASFIKSKKMILIGVFISLQVFITFRGIKYLKNGEWARPSYEEKSARTLNKWLHDNNHILLVSLPEPYYLYTNSSTQSTTADLPFLDPDSTLDNSKIYIVEDMGTYDYFPKFAAFLDNN